MLLGKPGRQRQHEISTHKKYNIKSDSEVIGCRGVN
jgi:hypothetical protein